MDEEATLPSGGGAEPKKASDRGISVPVNHVREELSRSSSLQSF